MTNLFLGEVGKALQVTFADAITGDPIDISGASTKEIRARKPVSGSSVEFPLSFVTDGTDGLAEYVTVADDIDEVGLWFVQGHVVGTGYDWFTEEFPVTVGYVIPEPEP